MAAPDDVRMPRYIISVAARLAGVSPHTLRAYEKAGLIQPSRTNGDVRLYSDADIELIRHIVSLTKRGVNLAGVKVILEMESRLKARA